MKGKLIIFSAPSGSGKTTLVRYLLEQNMNLAFSVSACSREKRPHETDGKDYYFISESEFRDKIKNDEFVEWEEVYRNHLYGTLKTEIERLLEKGLNVIFDVDVIGGMKIKKQYGSNALSIFVMPPSLEELKRRLLGRSTESMESLQLRIEKAGDEMKFADGFDFVLINDDLESAKKLAHSIVKNFLKVS